MKEQAMNKIAIAVHGGAGPDSEFIKRHSSEFKKGIEEALNAGFAILKNNGTSLDAVEAAVRSMEDNPLFNAGRGSALNERGEVEMEASLMNGKDKAAGAVCLLKNVKNPVALARAVLERTTHLYLGGEGALVQAQSAELAMMPDAYFISDHALQEYTEALKDAGHCPEDGHRQPTKRRTDGTVGAVALDKDGNIAAATSTGGMENKMVGRIGDSSVIGSGCYADNKTCAVSSTGDGEVILQNAVAFHVAALIQYKGLGVEEACRYLLREGLKEVKGDIGMIAIDTQGNIALEFNSERMHRGYRLGDKLYVATYPETERGMH